MKNTILLILFSLILLACSIEDELLIPTELENPSVMMVFCQTSLNDTLRVVEYKYEKELLISETSSRNGKELSKTSFFYNSENLVLSEVNVTDWRKTEKSYIYNADKNLMNILYKFTDFDVDGQVINETESQAPREYENNQLVKEWESWGGFKTYEYKDGKVATKIDHTKSGEEHHFTFYKYEGELLIEEKKETKLGTLMYVINFIYDSQNRLFQIRNGKNIIQENTYDNKKLLERREFYFGIDPGFSPCNGNFLYKFQY